MLTTVWIHRASAADILVHCSSRFSAYFFAEDMLERHGGSDATIKDWDFASFTDNGFDVGSSPSLQVSIHNGCFNPNNWFTEHEIHCWNHRGTLLITAQEALALGEQGEPEGFIPYESEAIWTRNVQTERELDHELATYIAMRA